jgi:hypothetical protein
MTLSLLLLLLLPLLVTRMTRFRLHTPCSDTSCCCCPRVCCR